MNNNELYFVIFIIYFKQRSLTDDRRRDRYSTMFYRYDIGDVVIHRPTTRVLDIGLNPQPSGKIVMSLLLCIIIIVVVVFFLSFIFFFIYTFSLRYPI